MTNQIISVKKNTERIRICVLFVISPQFRQWHCQKPTRINFFPSYFNNVIATIPFHFFLSQKNVTNETVSVKKNTERIRICVLFVISPLFRQCHCHKPIATNFVFSSYFGNAIATNSFPQVFFFSLNFGNGIATNQLE